MSGLAYGRTGKTLEGLTDRLTKQADKAFVRLGIWSNRQAVRVFARTIPRKWFRKVNPKALLVGEATLELPTGESEPTVSRMSAVQWEKFVQDVIIPPPSEDVVRSIIETETAGTSWQGRIEKLSGLVDPERTANALVKGYAEGKNLQELTRDVLPHVTGQVRSSAKRIARTEGLRVANEMQRQSYQDLGPLMVGIQILETLDNNTRPHHALRHGTIYFNDGRQPDISKLPVLPDEPNCRGFDIPVLKTPDEIANDPELKSEFENADGEPIPDPQTYSQWFDEADEGRRKLAVGVRRYAAVVKRLQQRGEKRSPKWTDFIDGNGVLLTLKHIAEETPTDQIFRLLNIDSLIASRADLIAKMRAAGFLA